MYKLDLITELLVTMCTWITVWLLVVSTVPKVAGSSTTRWSPVHVQCSPSAVFDGSVRNTRSGSLAMLTLRVGNKLLQECESAIPDTSCCRLVTPDNIHTRVTTEGRFSLSIQSTNSSDSFVTQFKVKEFNSQPYNNGCLFLDLANISNRYTTIEWGTITQNCSYGDRRVLRVSVFVWQCSSAEKCPPATDREIHPSAEFDPFQKTKVVLDPSVSGPGPPPVPWTDDRTITILSVCCGLSVVFLIAAVAFYRHKKGRNRFEDNKDEGSCIPFRQPNIKVCKTRRNNKYKENTNNENDENIFSIETITNPNQEDVYLQRAQTNQTNSMKEVNFSLERERINEVNAEGTLYGDFDERTNGSIYRTDQVSLHQCRGGQSVPMEGHQPLECSLIGRDLGTDEFEFPHEKHCQFRRSNEVYSSDYYKQLIGKINGLS